MRWAGKNAVTAFGLVTVTFWLSLAVFPQPIPPLGRVPNFEGLVAEITPWIREKVPSLNRPDREVIASLRREMLTVFTLAWLQIVTGVASGILITRRQRAGRWLAIALCAILLTSFAVAQGRRLLDHHFVESWTAMARFAPRLAIRSVLDVLFFVVTLVYLTQRRLGMVFDAVEASPAAR